MKRHEKGITLIALIITIIILIILTAITISNVMGSNLFGLAKGAAQNYVDAGKEEQDAIDELISAVGEIGKGENSNPQENEPTEEDLYRYILGPEEEGKERKRNLEEISTISDFVDSWDITDLQFTKDNTMETDISPLVKVLTRGWPAVYIEPDYIDYIYIKYKNKVYRITANESDYYATDLEKVYEPKGKEGEKVEYSYDGTEENKKEWTIIKDNQDGTVEIVSPEVIGSLTLGKSGSTTSETTNANVETSINDYNEAITKINDECKRLVTNNNIKVRSVGAEEDKTGDEDTYTSERISEWAETYPYLTAYNGRGKAGDTYYEDDLVRMSYHNVASVGSSYYMASRSVNVNSSHVFFCVYYVDEDGLIFSGGLWRVYSSFGYVGSYSGSHGVRPVVTIQYPVSEK